MSPFQASKESLTPFMELGESGRVDRTPRGNVEKEHLLSRKGRMEEPEETETTRQSGSGGERLTPPTLVQHSKRQNP